MADYAIHDTTLEAIADTIRKKDGTSALIDPADYSDRINLMGMLEEKTASSASVCSFSDGADDVPMSSVIAHIAPTLTGVSSVNVISAGGNIFDGVLESGWIDNNGADSSNADRVRSKNLLRCLPSTSYYVTCSDSWRVYWYDSTQAFISYSGTYSANRAVTSPSNAMYFRLAIIATEPTGVGMNYPSTDTSAQTPKAQTAYTASLGRTVYGADADLVSGQGSETYGKKVFDGTEGTGGTPSWTMISVTQGTMFRITVSDKATTSATNTLCSYYTPVAQAQRADGTVSGAGTNVDIIDDRFSSVDAFKAWLEENPVTLVYELATGTDFTFDGQEIPSLLGVNNLWHDAGETEAVYRSSGTVTPVPIQPVLISKTITENDTYSAEDDNADGYSEVIVNVQGGGGKIIVDDLIEYPYPSNNTNVIYSSQIAAQSAAYKAFVPDLAQYWTGSGATNNYIGWKFGTPQVVNFYEIWSRNQGNQYDYLQAPKEWILQGSNDDGETWVDLDTQDFTFTDSAEKWSSAISNTTAYKWYRIFVVTARDTANDTCIGYIDFKHAYIEEAQSLLSMSPAPVSQEESEEEENEQNESV